MHVFMFCQEFEAFGADKGKDMTTRDINMKQSYWVAFGQFPERRCSSQQEFVQMLRWRGLYSEGEEDKGTSLGRGGSEKDLSV